MKKNEEQCNIQMRQFEVCKMVLTKVVVGRKTKQTDWITWLYVALCDDSDEFN
jgi:hypothetical protein